MRLGAINTGSPLEALELPIDSTVARSTTSAYILGNLNADTTIPVTTANAILSGTLNASAAIGTTYSSSFVAQDGTGASQAVYIAVHQNRCDHMDITQQHLPMPVEMELLRLTHWVILMRLVPRSIL